LYHGRLEDGKPARPILEPVRANRYIDSRDQLARSELHASMTGKNRTETRAHGVRVLFSRHSEVQRLKQEHRPVIHGTRAWDVSWLLMDYIGRCRIKPRSHVLDVGCGWGILGIYCAKRHGARVTAVDKDPEVFPFVRLHARINRVRVTPLRADFDGVSVRRLNDVDVLVGSDICFWDSMVDPLRRLILRAVRTGVRTVLISDPGRSPFGRLVEHFERRGMGRAFEWSTGRPRKIRGEILRVDGGTNWL